MTIDEKRRQLMRYCESFGDECKGCLLDNHDEIEHCYGTATDDEVERSYNIVFGGKEEDYNQEYGYANLVSDEFIEINYNRVFDDKGETNNSGTYASGKFECIDVMIDAFGTDALKYFCILNAFKYLWRAEKKNGIKDIKKAVWYLNKYIELGDKGE